MAIDNANIEQGAGVVGAPPAFAARRIFGSDASLLIGIFVFILMLAVSQRLLRDPDTFFHIAAGNWIALHGVPAADPFSFTAYGMPWVAHEWLAELCFAGAYRLSDWLGVVVLTAVAIAFTYGLLAHFLEETLSRSGALIVATASFVLVAPHLLARPHVLAMPALIAWTIGLERARGTARPPSWRLLPLMTLWANLHGGFVLGLGLAGFYAGDAILEAPDRQARYDTARRWSIFLGAATVAALLTPYGIDGLLFAFRLSQQTFSLSFVTEWRSADFSHIGPLELGIVALIALGFTMRIRLPMAKLILLLVLIHLALAHRRDIDVLALLTPVLLARPLAEALPGSAAPRHSFLAARHFAAVAVAVGMAVGIAAWHGVDPKRFAIAPRNALAAAAAAGVTGPVFNAYDFGGYLVFAGIAPFVDGRVDLYGDDFMRAYADATVDQGSALPDLLTRYHIGWTLLQPQMSAAKALDHMPGWVRVYADDRAVVHRRIAVLPPTARAAR